MDEVYRHIQRAQMRRQRQQEDAFRRSVSEMESRDREADRYLSDIRTLIEELGDREYIIFAGGKARGTRRVRDFRYIPAKQKEVGFVCDTRYPRSYLFDGPYFVHGEVKSGVEVFSGAFYLPEMDISLRDDFAGDICDHQFANDHHSSFMRMFKHNAHEPLYLRMVRDENAETFFEVAKKYPDLFRTETSRVTAPFFGEPKIKKRFPRRTRNTAHTVVPVRSKKSLHHSHLK